MALYIFNEASRNFKKNRSMVSHIWLGLRGIDNSSDLFDPSNYPNLFEWVNARFYIDEFYEALLITPMKRLAGQLWSFDTWVVDGMVNGAGRATLLFAHASYWFDTYIVDGLVNFVAWLFQQFASLFKTFQSGRVQNYAFVMLLGFVLLMFFKFLG